MMQKLDFVICFVFLFRHGISRTDFNLLSDPELSFMEAISKIPSNPGATAVSKGTILEDEKMSSPSGSIKTESSVPFNGFSPLHNDQENGQGEEATKGLSEQLPGEDRTSEMGSPGSLSTHGQVPQTPSSMTMAPTLTSVETEEPTPLASAFGSGSPSAASAPLSQDQMMREEPGISAELKTEDMDDISRRSTPVPSQLNPAACQDEDSQLSFNQESQSSEASLFSVRWPKVRVSLNIHCTFQ